MGRSKITPNPPPSSRNPSSQAHNQPRAPGASSSQVERPAPSRSNLAQATPPVAGGASVPSPDFKKLYPWATPTLLKETSSVNSAGAVLRLKKGDEPHLSFHKEHDDKMMVLPCSPDMPVCADDKGNNGRLFCFVYTTQFKKVKLRFPFSRFERELLTELDIAVAQLHPNSWAFVRAFQIMCVPDPAFPSPSSASTITTSLPAVSSITVDLGFTPGGGVVVT